MKVVINYCSGNKIEFTKSPLDSLTLEEFADWMQKSPAVATVEIY